MVNHVRKHLESSNGFIGITSQLQSMKRIKAYESTHPRFTKETMADFGHGGTWNCNVLNVASVATTGSSPGRILVPTCSNFLTAFDNPSSKHL
jgi:hypothetical protein